MSNSRKWAIVIGVIGLILVYVLQQKLFYDPFLDFIYNPVENNYPEFNRGKYVFSKLLRFLFNDGFAIAIIYGIFGPGKYVKFAAYILLFGLFILLPTYLILVLYFYPESYSFLNHLHRLVLNPVLMMLLIPAFYSQMQNQKNG
jgi:exosortase F-associated protein